MADKIHIIRQEGYRSISAAFIGDESLGPLIKNALRLCTEAVKDSEYYLEGAAKRLGLDFDDSLLHYESDLLGLYLVQKLGLPRVDVEVYTSPMY